MATVVKEVAASTDLAAYCRDMARRAKAASAQMATLNSGIKIDWLRRSAALLRENVKSIEKANAEDLDAAPGYGLTPAEIDRLKLNQSRIESIAVALEEVAQIRDPIGRVIDSTVRPNGLRID
jgi:glutamate-5-semialdehyde dehydrogenase